MTNYQDVIQVLDEAGDDCFLSAKAIIQKVKKINKTVRENTIRTILKRLTEKEGRAVKYPVITVKGKMYVYKLIMKKDEENEKKFEIEGKLMGNETK